MDLPEITGTGEPELVADQAPEPGAGQPDAAATASDETFFDPSTLPEQLKPHWKRMQASFTKRMQGLRGRRDDLGLVDRYRSDPSFARAFLQQEAARLGLAITPTGAQAAPQAGAQPTSAPPAPLVEAIRRHLPPELHWMAPALAAGHGEAIQQTVEPHLRQQRQREVEARQRQWDDLAADLADGAPGWEEHEDEMLELLNFLQGESLTHRRWGSKLELLHRIVTGQTTATADAARRMGQSLRQRVVTGSPARSVVPNIGERVRAAKNNDQAWDEAARFAIEQMRSGGGGGT